MKTEIAKAEWKNAVEALNDAIILTIGGGYKGAESRAYFAMAHAARAALATKNQEPKTHTHVERAVNNQLVRSGEITADSGTDLGAGRQKRENADYSSFYESSQEAAHNACAGAARFLKETREYLLSRGLAEKELPEIPQLPGSKRTRPGGDPGTQTPRNRPAGGAETQAAERKVDRAEGQARD